MEYTFKLNNCINVIQLKQSQNKKLGLKNLILQTYHFDESQLLDFTNDSNNCFDCPYSFNQNNGKSGGCYTHKGLQFMGLKSMIKRLKNLIIEDFSSEKFESFLAQISGKKIELCRFGAYGEATVLPVEIIEKLVCISQSHTGYTHQWHKPETSDYSRFFMASTHNKIETSLANSMGFRTFESSNVREVKSAICPASKEFTGNKLTCSQCKACNGTYTGKRNNIFIFTH